MTSKRIIIFILALMFGLNAHTAVISPACSSGVYPAHAAVIPASCASAVPSAHMDDTPSVWSIGTKDYSAGEFALAPSGYKSFIQRDFGYEDSYYLVGHSSPELDFPYVLPGPVDTWGGTWPTAGWRTHQINILFPLQTQPSANAGFSLRIDLADFAKTFLPLLKVRVNEVEAKFQLSAPGYEVSAQRDPRQNEPERDTLSLQGDYSTATPYSIVVPLKGSDLREGGNEVAISVLEGSWVLFDRVSLEGEGTGVAKVPDKLYIRGVSAASYEIQGLGQPLIVDVEHLRGEPYISVSVDGKELFSQKIEKGRYVLEVPMKAVPKKKVSTYRVLCEGKVIACGGIVRSPQPLQTPADYVDTRIGTAHSRWMIAPGPWMPFSMVKLSPDNQNAGWQSGYQPSFENIACFSHIHEWTLAGLGLMATNGPLKIRPGDEKRPDEGYRSRIDKASETAGIGLYSVNLTDYGIKAELSATTRCGMTRFHFPSEKAGSRILLEFHPQSEYDFFIKGVDVRKVSPNRIEGSVHQLSPGVWSHDAEQDYIVHFVAEFDTPMCALSSWIGDKVTGGVEGLRADDCSEAGLAVEFPAGSTVTVRTGLSLVSVDNASENLLREITEPFGWDFGAVVRNQRETWNELLGRIDIKTSDRLEKVKFYNNMYRALCSRNTWSDVNGQWVSTDGKLRQVEDPARDVMLGSDAFWNTFWNLNQFWNLVTPEWSSRWVRSQLAMYKANGWLAKGPAGLNYIPVMVGEHEIPQIVGAYQMGIRDFDADLALEAAVKMQSVPSQKVFKGYAGNRDLKAYLEYGYVPYDKGRFSNTMEYSFDDWTVGQLAKALGDTATYRKFDDRGSWWQKVISPEGYCTMKDSKGEWLPDFDPFRSGANHHYVEGNAWQLTFFVPQDVKALVDKIGRKRFCDRLLWGFNQDEAFRYNAPNDQYWDHPVVQGNQQSMHFAYLFNFAGEPWNTQRWSRSILERYYGYGQANAYLGDEDQGQMSAWAIMASLGLFQTDGGCSVNPVYEIASPAFPEIRINLGGRYGRGDKFVIKALNASRKNVYVQSARLNGKPLRSFAFPASELLKGGELLLQMGPEPNKDIFTNFVPDNQ